MSQMYEGDTTWKTRDNNLNKGVGTKGVSSEES